eukprot:TRINITY_DN6645_c0_g1_i3.p1 TRINITY_DN6645_c0_g1~~TRINITY_DN6645_c0_g1_i3.p1  ORF type:complete len:1198 (-),score=441.24 TRINITY_DN6645_c0_g1_i3:48-3245(-)
MEIQGFLNKRKREGSSKSRQYWYYLKGNYLFYLKHSKPSGLISMAGAKVTRLEGSKDKKRFAFSIFSLSGKEEVLYAKDKSEMKDWIEACKQIASGKPFHFTSPPDSNCSYPEIVIHTKGATEEDPKEKERLKKLKSDQKKAKKKEEKERKEKERAEKKEKKQKEKELKKQKSQEEKEKLKDKINVINANAMNERSGSRNSEVEEEEEGDSSDEEDERAGPTRRKESFVVRATIPEDDKENSPFRGAGETGGVTIWRIEKMVPVRIRSEEYGKFANRDTYLVLHTAVKSDGLHHEIYYWLGKDAEVDKIGGAAIRAVQLSDHFGGQSVHHREVQYHESESFLALFHLQVVYIEGGVPSGFRHFEKGKKEPRLLSMKGHGTDIWAHLEPETSVDLMNRSESYVLDLGEKVIIWNGPKTTKVKRAKALEIAIKLNNENNAGKGKVYNTEDSDSQEILKEFWKNLKAKSEADVPDEDNGNSGNNAAKKKKSTAEGEKERSEEGEEEGVEEEEEEEEEGRGWLYRVSQVDDDVKVTPIEDENLSKDMLDSNAAFVLDSDTEIFVWNGKYADVPEKRAALMLAEEFIQMFDRPVETPITRVLDSAEPILFRDKFLDWFDAPTKSQYTATRIAAAREQTAINVETLHRTKSEQSESFFEMTPESDCLEVWTIESNSKATPIQEDEFGIFYTGKSYITLFSYIEPTKNQLMSYAYFWEGSESKAQSYIAYKFGFYDLLVNRMKDEGGHPPVQVKVYQGKEPDNFLQIFNRKKPTIITRTDFLSGGGGKTAMFRVVSKGTLPHSIVAVQSETADSSRLCSSDTFVVKTTDSVFVWKGEGSSERERKFGLRVAGRIRENSKVVEVEEGKESSSFWECLGGKKEYASSSYLKKKKKKTDGTGYQGPRLFQCSEGTGIVEVEEISRFDQNDLIDSDVMILDAYYELFVWEGSTASQAEMNIARTVSKDYVEKAKDGRPTLIPIVFTGPGREPLAFKCQFPSWSDVSQKKKEVFEKKSSPSFQPDSPLISELRMASTKRAARAVTSPSGTSPIISPNNPVTSPSSTSAKESSTSAKE